MADAFFVQPPLHIFSLSVFRAIHLFSLGGGGSTTKCNLPQMLRKHQLSLMDCEREINVYNYVTGAPKVAETCGLIPCSACGKGMQGQ